MLRVFLAQRLAILGCLANMKRICALDRNGILHTHILAMQRPALIAYAFIGLSNKKKM